MAETISPQQRAMAFAMSTRENQQMVPKETTTSPDTTLEFSLPKARYLCNILAEVTVKFKAKHGSKTAVPVSAFTPFRIIRRWSLDMNNGFTPYVVSGEELAMLNIIDRNGDVYLKESPFRNCPAEGGTFTSSVAGESNEFSFYVDITNAVNRRDPVSLILLQSRDTNITLSASVGNASDMFPRSMLGDGFTFELEKVEVLPTIETFSVPDNVNALPDISVLRMVNGRSDSMPSEGQQIISLTTGEIYRKIIFQILDENGNPVDDSWITSPIEIVFNQADVNYSVNPRLLRALNHRNLGFPLPKGMYVFDFSSVGGEPNMGGSRDYIDSSKLTELWLRFSTSGKGKIHIVKDSLARLG